jgi:hypothetical protein
MSSFNDACKTIVAQNIKGPLFQRKQGEIFLIIAFEVAFFINKDKIDNKKRP